MRSPENRSRTVAMYVCGGIAAAVSWLEAKAERSEKMAIDSMIEHILESPPPVKSERCQLTLVKDEARRPGVSPGKIVAIGMDAVVSPGPQ